MPTGIVTISQYSPEPPLQFSTDDVLEVRGWYSRDFIGGDQVTPVYGNSTNGEQPPYYYSTTPTLNASGNLVVPAHDIQATTLSNPTANYFEGLWVNGAFNQFLMPNTEGASGWQIPTVYGAIIAIDEIATYNRAQQLLYPPNTYFTADETILEIERLAGNFDYMAVGVNGIGQASFAPVVASEPIVLMENDPRVGNWFNVLSYGASTSATAAQNTTAIGLAIAAATAVGGGIYWPNGYLPVNTITISVPSLFAPGASGPQPANGQTVTFTKAIFADASKHFDNALSGQGTISFSGNALLATVYAGWWGTGSAAETAARTAFATGSGGVFQLADGSVYIGTSTLSGSGTTFTKLVLDGDMQFRSIPNTGPSYGVGLAGIGYRATGETISDPALVIRAKGYLLENTTPEWVFVISDDGRVGIGIVSTQSVPDPQYQLDVQSVGVTDPTVFNGDLNVDARIASEEGLKGLLFGHLTSEMMGAITAQGASAGISFIANSGGAWREPLRIATNGNIGMCKLANGGFSNADPPERILELRGSVSGDPIVRIRRTGNTQVGAIEFTTATTQDWLVGERDSSDSDLHVFNFGTTADAVTITRASSTVTIARLLAQGEGAVLSISGNAITPTHSIHHVGAGLIKTITVPSGFASGVVTVVPDAAFTYDATGNINVPSGGGTAVVDRVMTFTYSSSSSKWYPSY